MTSAGGVRRREVGKPLDVNARPEHADSVRGENHHPACCARSRSWSTLRRPFLPWVIPAERRWSTSRERRNKALPTRLATAPELVARERHSRGRLPRGAAGSAGQIAHAGFPSHGTEAVGMTNIRARRRDGSATGLAWDSFRDHRTVYMASTWTNGHFRSVSEVPVLMVGRHGLEPWTH